MAEFILDSMAGINRSESDSDENPIREELFSVERLEQYAAELAAEHTVSSKPDVGRRLLPRVEENGRRLIAVYRTLVDAMRGQHTVSSVAAWLVDNFQIIEEQIREIRRDLPKSYYKSLPKLQKGELAGYPRVYALDLLKQRCFADAPRSYNLAVLLTV